MNRSGFSMTLVAGMIAVAGVAGDASARKQAASAPEVGIRGQREAKDISYGPWKKLCFKAGGAPVLCRTSITGTFATGQLAVRMDFIERDGDKRARLQLFVPVGMYLQHPPKLRIDGSAAHTVPYTWCLTNACIAADAADPELIKEMETGKEIVLEVVDSNLLALTTKLPLLQFAAARKGAPAQTLEQDIDE
jgi:invasion protein IalB